jgi:hypothetical protein
VHAARVFPDHPVPDPILCEMGVPDVKGIKKMPDGNFSIQYGHIHPRDRGPHEFPLRLTGREMEDHALAGIESSGALPGAADEVIIGQDREAVFSRAGFGRCGNEQDEP